MEVLIVSVDWGINGDRGTKCYVVFFGSEYIKILSVLSSSFSYNISRNSTSCTNSMT